MAELIELVRAAGATAVLDAIHGKGAGRVKQHGTRTVYGTTALATKALGWQCARAGGLYDLWAALAAAGAETVEAAAWEALAAAERGCFAAGDRVAVTGSIYRGTVTKGEPGDVFVRFDRGEGEDAQLYARKAAQRVAAARLTKIEEG